MSTAITPHRQRRSAGALLPAALLVVALGGCGASTHRSAARGLAGADAKALAPVRPAARRAGSSAAHATGRPRAAGAKAARHIKPAHLHLALSGGRLKLSHRLHLKSRLNLKIRVNPGKLKLKLHLKLRAVHLKLPLEKGKGTPVKGSS